MTYSKPEPAKESLQRLHAKAPYRAPKLEVLGSLRSATRGTGPANGDAGQGMMVAAMSDRRAKEDIVRIGQHPLGLGIYVFRYKGPWSERYGNQRRVGVMADEVAEKYPDAVSRHEDGYLMVDYGRLFH
jgi:hypothetical protein